MSTSTEQQTAVHYEKDADGIVTLTLDDPTASANTMNELYQASMEAAVQRLHDEVDDVTGVVLTSAKKTFFAGGDLNDLKQATPERSDEIAGFPRHLSQHVGGFVITRSRLDEVVPLELAQVVARGAREHPQTEEESRGRGPHEQRCEPEARDVQQLGGEHRVEETARLEIAEPAQQAQVVVAAVHDQVFLGQHFPKRLKPQTGRQHIDQKDLPVDQEL